METLSFGGRPVAGFGLGASSSGSPTPPKSPSAAAFGGALAGGITGMLVGIFVGGAVYDAEGVYGHSRSGINATGPILAGSATTLIGAAIGAWALTPSTPTTPAT